VAQSVEVDFFLSAPSQSSTWSHFN